MCTRRKVPGKVWGWKGLSGGSEAASGCYESRISGGVGSREGVGDWEKARERPENVVI